MTDPPPFDPAAVAWRLRALRTRYGLSTKELGKRLGISHVSVSNMERGKTRLTIARVRAVAEALNTTMDDAMRVPERWEYDNLPVSLERAAAALNERGAEGWEAFAVVPLSGGRDVLVLLKRRSPN